MAKKKPKKEKEKRSELLSFNNFYQFRKPKMHLYLKAYLEPTYRGTLKTEKEWFEELKQFLEE